MPAELEVSGARALLTQLRDWARGLPPSSVVISEELNPNYGGLLFKVRPCAPNALTVTVGLGLGEDDSIDCFWGDGYRWENWKPLRRKSSMCATRFRKATSSRKRG